MQLHLYHHDPAPLAYIKVILYREFGWTREYVGGMPLADILELLTILQEEAAHRNRPRNKK